MAESGIRILRDPITRAELAAIARTQFGDMVKAVVDIQNGIMAVGGELHSDEEALLIEVGSLQSDLWGVNLYHDDKSEAFLEFDSMINIRPAQGNRSRSVESDALRARITTIVRSLVSDA